ncbi:hypothetical protein [Kitasatospora sp. P5_F3]
MPLDDEVALVRVAGDPVDQPADQGVPPLGDRIALGASAQLRVLLPLDVRVVPFEGRADVRAVERAEEVGEVVPQGVLPFLFVGLGLGLGDQSQGKRQGRGGHRADGGFPELVGHVGGGPVLAQQPGAGGDQRFDRLGRALGGEGRDGVPEHELVVGVQVSDQPPHPGGVVEA